MARALHTLLVLAVLALAALPAPALAQSMGPIGVYFNLNSTGSAGGDHTLVAINEDGSASMTFFNLQDGLSTVYTGVWVLDPYGTVTLELVVGAEESCSDEATVGTVTFLPSTTGDSLTAVHYPSCLWGNGGLTLFKLSGQQMAEIEQAYADAGQMPGLVFQTAVLETDDGAERQYALNLGAAEQATLSTDSLDGEPPAVELGEWTANVYTVTVTLTGTVDSLYEEPEVLAFGFVKDGTRSIVAYEFDREKYGEQGLEMTYQPQLPALIAQSQAMTATEIAGIYSSDILPAADTPGLIQTLALFDSGEAQNTYNYLNGETPTVELGAWQDNEDGTVTVELDDAPVAEDTSTDAATDAATVTTTDTMTVTTPVTTPGTITGTITGTMTYSVSDQQLLGEDGVILHKLPVVEPGSQNSEASE